jgi:hypothetical protein
VTVVLDVGDDDLLLVLAVFEELVVALAVDEPAAELDVGDDGPFDRTEEFGGRTPGLFSPLPALGHMVITASSLGPADM